MDSSFFKRIGFSVDVSTYKKGMKLGLNIAARRWNPKEVIFFRRNRNGTCSALTCRCKDFVFYHSSLLLPSLPPTQADLHLNSLKVCTSVANMYHITHFLWEQCVVAKRQGHHPIHINCIYIILACIVPTKGDRPLGTTYFALSEYLPRFIRSIMY